jgi:plastocyanin
MKTICAALISAAVILAAVSATAATHNVTVAPGGSFTFSPADIVVAAGDTVHWVWDGTGHNVRSGVPGSPTPYFYSGLPAAAGTTFDVVFDMAFVIANPVPGNVYDYYCEPHGLFGMVGSVEVTIATGVVADPATDRASWSSIKALYR